MFLLFQIAFVIGFLLTWPWYLLKMLRRGNYRNGFPQRFAFYSSAVRQRVGDGGWIWIQAVSVGEARVALLLIEQLRQRWPQARIALSTTTSTGQALARKLAPPEVLVIYFPLDFILCVKSALNLLRPRMLILVETEVWPTLVLQAAARNIPVVMVNGRLSDKSYRGYRLLGKLCRRVYGAFSLVCAQGPRDLERYAGLGVHPDILHSTGSLKFDEAQTPSAVAAKARDFLKGCGVNGTRPIWVCGSTHNGEEEIVFRIFHQLKKKFPDLFLVLAPRHPERTNAVKSLAQQQNIRFVLRTESPQPGIDCLLLNTTGELKAFYETATVIFVGKSLRGRGGQNIIEAAVTGAPVLFGPAMQNFEAIADAFVREGAAIQVPDEAGLLSNLEELLAQADRRQAIGNRARQVVTQSSGAAQRTLNALAKLNVIQ